ncbi:MAG TPA: oligopeptidase B, partial [Burkholderiaceae bacterium]
MKSVVPLILALGALPAMAADLPLPPVAAKAEWRITRHNEVVTDDYRWLQDKKDPKVIAYLNAENAYTEAVTATIKPLSETLFAEIKGRMKEADLSVPTRQGAYYYYSRTEAGKQYVLLCRKRAAAGGAFDDKAVEEVLLDQNKLAEGHKFFAVGDVEVSPDGNLYAYTTDTTGFRQFKLHVRDLRTGKDLPDTAERVTSIAWAQDNRTLFLAQEDATTKRSDRLFRLALGGAPVQVLHEADELYRIGVETSRDGKFIMLSAGATDTSEVRMLSASEPLGTFKSVLGRTKGHRYDVEHRNGELFIVTNRDAKNFRVVRAKLSTP